MTVKYVLMMFLSSIAFEQYSQERYIGIPPARMDYFAAGQRQSQWCWAASIQMVLNYYGVAISQEQIVARTYGMDPFGRPPNRAGSLQLITANLNNWNIDNQGRLYTVTASLRMEAPTPTILIQELSQQKPIIVVYSSGPNSSHAVVVTAARFISSPQGAIILSLVVRDPWPSEQNISNLGRIEHPGRNLASLIQAHWYIQVQIS